MSVVKLLVNLFQFNRTNWKAVSLCFLAAAVFWFFNAFNKNYSTEIRFPLQVAYNENRFIPLETLPTELRLNVNGNGWDLFRKSFGISLPELTLTIERPLEIKKIPATVLSTLLAPQLGGLIINQVVLDTLHVQFDERDVHTFKLEADLTDVWYREGFGCTSPVVILPDSVRLEGPRTILHRMASVLKVKLPKLTLDENYRDEIQIELPDSLTLAVTPTHVTVMFEIGPMETLLLQLPVEIRNRPASVLKVEADSVQVSFRLPQAHRARIQEELKQLVVRVDLKDKPRGTHKVLPVISRLPVGVEATIDSLEIRF